MFSSPQDPAALRKPARGRPRKHSPVSSPKPPELPTWVSLANPYNSTPYPITRREHEILSLLTRGLSDQDIALNLSLETSTIRTHISGLCHKLQAINRVQLAVLAVRAGLSL